VIINIQDDYQSVLVATDATPNDVTPSPDFVLRIVDEFGDTPDEWVLITEDGLVISIEPSDDEFGITVE